jgi:hypothetical protein
MLIKKTFLREIGVLVCPCLKRPSEEVRLCCFSTRPSLSGPTNSESRRSRPLEVEDDGLGDDVAVGRPPAPAFAYPAGRRPNNINQEASAVAAAALVIMIRSYGGGSWAAALARRHHPVAPLRSSVRCRSRTPSFARAPRRHQVNTLLLLLHPRTISRSPATALPREPRPRSSPRPAAETHLWAVWVRGAPRTWIWRHGIDGRERGARSAPQRWPPGGIAAPPVAGCHVRRRRMLLPIWPLSRLHLPPLIWIAVISRDPNICK